MIYEKYLENMVPIGTIDKNQFILIKDSGLYLSGKRLLFGRTAVISMIMIIYGIVGRVNSKYYSTILGKISISSWHLISFIIAFVVCYATFIIERWKNFN